MFFSNISLTKKRIKMKTKKRSAPWSLIKVAAALPELLAVLFLLAAGSANNLSAQDTQQKTTPQQQQAISQEKPSSEQEVFIFVEKMPSYPGGEEAIMKFLLDNIKYPELARTNGIQGTVYVKFIVEKDGSVTNVNLQRGIGGGCDEEAVRVVSIMPKWISGKQNGKTVRVQFILPIKFALDSKTDKKEGEKK
jgi:TonB family protein